MEIGRTLFDDIDGRAEADADARAEADVRDGRTISHGAVKRWLQSWGTDRVTAKPLIGE